jgi:hypothetical protein
MKTRSTCRCLLCQLEFHLKQQLREARHNQVYSIMVSSCSSLSGFLSPFALAGHLRACRSNGNGSHPADAILHEMLHVRAKNLRETLLRDALLLAFIPVLHSTARQIARLHPSLVGNDTAQHLVLTFLETLDSPDLLARTSHLAFAISRHVRRSVFSWAEREARSPGNGEWDQYLSEAAVTPDVADSFERVAELHHFLFRCQRDGLLTGPDLELLVHIKLEGNLEESNGVRLEYSNALRQKIKRLLSKLREAARLPTIVHEKRLGPLR